MDKLSYENEQKLSSTITLIEKIVNVGMDALEKFPSDGYEIEIFVFLNYLERFTYNLDSINILLKNYRNKFYVETSVGIILRANLLDFMAITYLSTYQADITSANDKENKEKYNKQFNALIVDHIHNTFKYLKLANDSNLIKNSEYRKSVESIFHTYKFLFKDDAVDYENPRQKLISADFKSPTDYFKRINNHPLTSKFAKVYDLYTYYSKYEHFGIMTHFLQRQGFDHDFETMVAAIKYITRGIGATFSYLSYPINKLEQEKDSLNELQEEFDKL